MDNKMNNYRCPICGAVPYVISDNGVTDIFHCEIKVHSPYFESAIKRWKKICNLFHVEKEINLVIRNSTEAINNFSEKLRKAKEDLL